jgi:tripartite-type tricarboxylate transporter receptor subunit TctC
VVVDNKPGASGTIGAQAVARSAPNGHILMMNVGTLVVTPALLKSVPYDVATDFAPITRIGVVVFALAVNTAFLPKGDTNALLVQVRVNPGKLNYASPGNGTPHHIGMEFLKQQLGLDVTHIPYKASAGAFTDLIGGRVQMMYSVLQPVFAQAQAGKVRLLAVTGPTRWPTVPDVPTFREQGMEFMDALGGWMGMFAPARTPVDIVAAVNAETRRALALPELRDNLMKQGILPLPSTPEEFSAQVKGDLARMARFLSEARITAD